MSESNDNNVEFQEEEFYVEDIDLEAIGKRFESQTLLQRIKMLMRGLKAPSGSREYKEALIELQRLTAPVGAIVIPLIFIAILFVCSVPEKSNKDLRDINVARAEEEASLEEPPPEMEDLTEQMDQTVETEVLNDIANPSLDNLQTPTDVVTPSPNTDTPIIENANAVMDIQAPVKMRTVLGQSRSAGARARSLAKFGGDAETEGNDNAVSDTGDVDNRGPLLVRNTHGLERRRNGVEQVHADNEHADHVEHSPEGVGEHVDSGEPHVADDFALVVQVQVVFTELEHHEVLHEEAENEETGPDHGEGCESLLALASVDFVVDATASLLVLDLQLDSKEDVEGKGSHQHQFNKINHLDREVERVESGQEFGVGIVRCLSRSLIEIQKLEVTTHVAEDEQGEERACASHDLLLTDRGGKILDDPLH